MISVGTCMSAPFVVDAKNPAAAVARIPKVLLGGLAVIGALTLIALTTAVLVRMTQLQPSPLVVSLVAIFGCALTTSAKRRATIRPETARPSFDSTVPVLILNLGGFPYNQSSVGIARSLGRVGISVYLVQQGSFIPAAASRHLAGRFIWNTNGLQAERFMEGMAAIHATLRRPAIVVPTCDLAAILLAENADALSQWFMFAQPPPDLPRSVSNKKTLYELCRRIGVSCPRTYFPTSRGEILDLAARLQFPIVVKGAEAWLLPPGIRSTQIVSTPDHLIGLFDAIARQPALTSLAVQEMIPDEVAEDWIVHGYCDASGEALRIFTGIKLRSYPAFSGGTSFGRCMENDMLRRQAKALFSAVGYRGIMDLDYRLDRRDGQYKLLDFNPRIGAQFRLFEDDSEIDLVRTLHLDLTGRPIPLGEQVEGRTFLAEIHDALGAWRYIRAGRLTANEWLRSVIGVDEGGWFARDDPAPFLLFFLRYLADKSSRVLPFSLAPGLDEKLPRLISRSTGTVSTKAERVV